MYGTLSGSPEPSLVALPRVDHLRVHYPAVYHPGYTSWVHLLYYPGPVLPVPPCCTTRARYYTLGTLPCTTLGFLDFLGFPGLPWAGLPCHTLAPAPRDSFPGFQKEVPRTHGDARAITRGLDNSACHEGPAPGRLIWQKVTKVAKVVILALARA